MPEYRPYSGIAALMRHLEKKIKTISIPNYYDRLLEMSYDCIRAEKYTDFFTTMVEANHYFMAHHVLLLGKNLSEMLYRSKISVALDLIRLPFSTFEVDFDKTMTVPDTNIPLPSVLCSFRGSEVVQEFEKRFCDDLGRKYKLPEKPKVTSPNNLITFRMTDPREKNMIFRPMLVFNVSLDKCRDMEIEQIIEEAPFLKSADEPLNKEDQRIVKAAIKLTLGAICYLNLQNHEAASVKPYNRPRIGLPAKVTLLGKRCPSAAFMREGHIRTLVHPRFKRDESGKPRMIWVREHMVNPIGDMSEKDAKNIEMGDEFWTPTN